MRLLVCTVFTHQKCEDKATTADLPPPNLSFFLSSLHCRRCVPTCVRLQWSSSAVLAPEQLHVNMLISQIQVSVICLFSTGYIYVMHCSYNPVLRWCRQNKKQFEVGGNKTNSVLLQFVVYVCVCVCVCVCVHILLRGIYCYQMLCVPFERQILNSILWASERKCSRASAARAKSSGVLVLLV